MRKGTRVRKLLLIFLLPGLFLAGTGSATAEGLLFKSPSGNIECGMHEYGADCSIRDFTQTYTTKPEDCDFDWGNHFVVEPKGKGILGCFSDYRGEPTFTMPYGSSLSYNGVTCNSEPTGMTCVNRDGGGFSIRRAKQSLF